MSQVMDRGRAGPKYLEIRNHLLQQFYTGAFSPGQALPKERELALSLDVARGTLRQALRGLEREGLIRRVRGKGTFVNSRQQRRAQVCTDVLSLIVPGLRDDLYAALAEGAEGAAVRAGLRLMTSNTNNDVARQETLIREAAAANVAGVLLVPATRSAAPRLGTPDQVRPLRDDQIPIVFCHRSIPGVAAPVVTWPFVDVGRRAAEVLLACGHRRIAGLPYMEEVFVEAAAAGFRQTMRDQGVDPAGYRVVPHGGYQRFSDGERLGGEYARAAIRKALETVLSGANRPTAIQCFNAFDAEQVYLLAGEMGCRIPQDLSLIFFGAQRRTGALAQRITCVGVDEYEIGVRACGLLAEMNSGLLPHEVNQTIEISLAVLPGETIGPPPN